MSERRRAFADFRALPSLWRIGMGCWLGAALMMVVGCHGSTSSQRKIDTALQRHTKHGGQAYADGHVELAIAEYRKAVGRAWAMDDPYESGTAAYNLAACLTSAGRSAEAKDWLLDARIELHRACESAGNVWLLEAKIAQAESRFEDAQYLVHRAACAEPPCPSSSSDEQCGDGCLTKVPCIGPKIKARKAGQDCRDLYQAQIHLVQARSAAEQYDLPVAKRQLACACALAGDLCSQDLQAELHNVAALIHIAKGEFLQAGHDLDRETRSLRLSGNFREIPKSLELASAAYDQAGLPELAADRLCRAARVLCGRGAFDQAWHTVEMAVVLAEMACAETTKVRLSLLANEILLALAERGDPLPAIAKGEEVGMLAPEGLSPSHGEPAMELLPAVDSDEHYLPEIPKLAN